jgi:hypothetical protein
MTPISSRTACLGAAVAQFFCFAGPIAHAQSQSLDGGVLLIFQDGTLIGREEFAVRRGTTSATQAGFTLASTALYPADRPEHTVVSVIELGPDSLAIAGRFEGANDGTLRVAIGIGPRRIAVRRATATGESAREYPARGRPLILDDSVFVSLAVRPPAAGPGPTISAAGELGDAVRVLHRGIQPTLLAGERVDLDQILIEMPSGPLTAWYDPNGRLVKIDWPSRRMAILRQVERR